MLNYKKFVTVAEGDNLLLNTGLDMDGNKIIELASGTVSTDAVNFAQLNTKVSLSGNETIAGTKTFSSTISGNISGNAATVTNGVYTTGNQTIGGTKTFSNTIVGNLQGNVSGNVTGDLSGNASTATNATTVTNGVYTTGDQTIGGNKTFTGVLNIDHTTGSLSHVPSGTIFITARSAAPTGFLLCDGSAISRATYAALFAAIGTTYGGSGGNFNVPDFRGVFPRGVGNPVGYADSTAYNVTLGQKRDDVFQGHTHNDSGHNHHQMVVTGSAVFGALGSNIGLTNEGATGYANLGQPVNSGYGTPRLSTETAPKSLGVNFIIKF